MGKLAPLSYGSFRIPGAQRCVLSREAMAPRTDTAPRLVRGKTERISPLGVIAPPPIHVESPRFSGSLAMLFACVRDRKVDLLDVPLAPICEAYFDYLMRSGEPDLDEAAAALAALAYLLERKAWALLPVETPEPEADESLELLPPSVHEYELAIEALRRWQEERERLFFRPHDAGPNPYELPFQLGNVTPGDLARAFERALARATPTPFDSPVKPRRSLSDQMGVVLRALSDAWQPLEALMPAPFTRADAVYSFLAVLELIRLGQATLRLVDGEVVFARPGARKR